MHEWALAEGVIGTALEHADREELSKLTRIVVRVGELQRINPDFFRKALHAVMPEDEPRLAGVELELKLEPTELTCRRCERRFTLAETRTDLDRDEREAIHFVPELAHAYLVCPGCESPDFEVVRGRGLWVDRLEGER